MTERKVGVADVASGAGVADIGSPAIDAGIDLSYSQDLDGQPVPKDGDGVGGAAADLGAYEYGG